MRIVNLPVTPARRLLAAAALALSFLAAGSTARAQDIEPPFARRTALKIGAFLPSNGTYKSAVGSMLPTIGLDFNPAITSPVPNSIVSLGAEFRWKSSGGRNNLTIPVTARLLFDLTRNEESQNQTYAGIGGGLYFINVPFKSGTTQPGIKLLAGVNFGTDYFVEANYDFVSGFSNNLGQSLRVDGISLSIGRRF
jgi:hypothetical protein